jgi:hypothetical protein
MLLRMLTREQPTDTFGPQSAQQWACQQQAWTLLRRQAAIRTKAAQWRGLKLNA